MVLLAFAAATVLILFMPGPDMMLTIRNATRAGRRGAAWTAAGILTGVTFLAIAAALGLTAIFTTSPVVFTVVKVAGGAYLLYLGVQSLRGWWRSRREAIAQREAEAAATSGDSATRPGGDPDDTSTGSHAISAISGQMMRGSLTTRAAYRQGLMSTMLNPKLAVFFLSMFPQFDIPGLTPTVNHLVLAVIFASMSVAFYALFVLFIGWAERIILAPAFARRLEAIAGSALVVIGAVMLGSVARAQRAA